MTHPVISNTFTLERSYPHPPEKVFRAFSDPTKKRRWFAEGEGFIVDSYSMDFTIGGFERSRFRFGASGPPMTLDSVYMDIVGNERLVYGYWMTIGDAPLSSSLASMDFIATKSGTLLRLTEHTMYLDGNDGSASRREGTAGLLLSLGKELDVHP